MRLVALVPRQHEHRFERRERARKPLLCIVDRLRPGKRERVSAGPEGALLGEDRATKCGLLDVARSRRDVVVFERRRQRRRAARDHSGIDPQDVAPEHVAIVGVDPWCLDARQPVESARETRRHCPCAD